MENKRTNIKKTVENKQDITVADMLSGFDDSIRLLLERSYFDTWPKELNRFSVRNFKLNWEDSFFGLKLLGMRHYGKKEQELALQNIENVLSLFRDGSHSFITAISGTQNNCSEIAFLACQREYGKVSISSKSYVDVMKKSWQANFPGSECADVCITEYQQFTEKMQQNNYLGVMTGIPGRKRPEEGFFSQGIERLLDTVSGLDYQIMVLSEPLTVLEINKTIDQVLALKNQVGLFHKATLNESSTVSKALSKTIGGYGGGSISDTIAKTVGKTVSHTIGAILGIPMRSIFVGISAAMTFANSIATTTSHTASSMGGGFASLSSTKTHALTKGTAREVVNYAVENALEILDEYLERLKYARSYGFWKTGVYLSTPDQETYIAVKNAMLSQFSGENSSLEPLRVVDLDFSIEGESVASTLDRKKSFLNEVIAGYNPELTLFSDLRNDVAKELGEELPFASHPLGDIFNGLYTPMTTGELAILVAPPQRECRSVSVTERGAFAGKKLDTNFSEGLRIGEPLYYGARTGESLSIPFNEMTRHVFVCGTTGSGKTNTVKQFCKQFSNANIPWLVIEPGIKTEYGSIELEDGKRPLHFSLGFEEDSEEKGIPFRMNPFYFPKGIGLLTHVDRLKSAFNAAFPMYASMPYILEEAILEIYRDNGWNILDGSNIHSDDPWNEKNGELLFPILSQLQGKIDAVVAQKNYDVRLQLDISAALKARIGSLLQGGKGSMLNTHHNFPMEDILQSPVVMDMAGIGNQDEKALIMGFLFTSVFEHASLRRVLGEIEKPDHILIIEEAHNLLKNTQGTDNPEVANVRGAAIEQFATMLAELRGLAEGIVVVDQVPTKLIPDVIKNSNLKVVHQLCAADDRELVGSSMLLDQNQKDELGRLNRNRGEAAVYHPLWEKTYSVSVEKVQGELAGYQEKIELIQRYEHVYGKNPYAKIKRTREYGTSLARVLYGVAFKNVKMVSSGINEIYKKPPIGKPLNDISAVLNSQKELFEVCLLDLLRVSGGKINLLSECPDRFDDLIDAILSNSNEVADKMDDLHRDLEELKGVEHILLKFASQKYTEMENLQLTAEKIGTKFSVDEVYERLQKKALEHVKRILGESFAEYEARIEKSLVEQFLISSGFLFSTEILEQYSHRFLS